MVPARATRRAAETGPRVSGRSGAAARRQPVEAFLRAGYAAVDRQRLAVPRLRRRDTARLLVALRGVDGGIWLPQDTITVQRTYLYDDTERLAREIQEQRLLTEMQSDAIAQIVRRLQAAKKA